MRIPFFTRPKPEPQAIVPAAVPVQELKDVVAPILAELGDVRRQVAVIQQSSAVRAMDDPYRHLVPTNPRWRPFSPVDTDTLRKLARTYDVLAACIAHLKTEVIKIPIKVVPRDEENQSEALRKRAEEANEWFGVFGGLGGQDDRETFEGKLLDDLLILGAAAVSFGYDTKGAAYDRNPDSVTAIDAATIEPVVDAFGYAGDDEADVYRQWIQGVIAGSYKRYQVAYDGLPIFAQTSSPYFMSAVEQLVIVVYTALKADEWNRTWLTDGNTADSWLVIPENMNPETAKTWVEVIDVMLSGNSAQRHKIKYAPGEVKTSGTRKDQDFGEFEDWLATRTMSLMGVNPASIGHNGGQYEANQDAAQDSTSDNRVMVLRKWRLRFYNQCLHRKGWDDLEVIDDIADAEESKTRAERHNIEVGAPTKTINEARRENGEDPIEGGDVLLIPQGMSTLKALLDAEEAPPPQTPPVPSNSEPSQQSSVQPASDAQQAPAEEPQASRVELARVELQTWQRKSLNRLQRNQLAACEFMSEVLSPLEIDAVMTELHKARDKETVRGVFARASERLERKGRALYQPWSAEDLEEVTKVGPADAELASYKATPKVKSMTQAEVDE